MKNKIKENTLLGMELFKDSFIQALIFHIPHSKTEIPKEYNSDFLDDELTKREINLLTDFYTDELFSIENTTKIVFPYSRVFCDVERLIDEEEEMFKVGRGFYYTKTDRGQELRRLNKVNKDKIFHAYYMKHHEELTRLVDCKLKENTFAIIVDCHSFTNTPFRTDLNQNLDRSDFCLGTDSFHTPKWLSDMIFNHLSHAGYSVEINAPYQGTLVPAKHYKKDPNVHSIMIEVNRGLYMDSANTMNHSAVQSLNELFRTLFT